MQRARILAAALSLTAPLGIFALAVPLLHEADAFAAPRRRVSPRAATRKAAALHETRSGTRPDETTSGDRSLPEPAPCSGATPTRDRQAGELRCAGEDAAPSKAISRAATAGVIDAGVRSAGDAAPSAASLVAPPTASSPTALSPTPPPSSGFPRLAVEPRREATGDGGYRQGNALGAFVESIAFENGDVPRAAAALDRMRKDFGRCAAEAQGVVRNDGAIDLRFLVRAPGRAEGVDVVQTKGVSVDVVRCVTSTVARRLVGPPSDEPVAVSITVRFKKE